MHGQFLTYNSILLISVIWQINRLNSRLSSRKGKYLMKTESNNGNSFNIIVDLFQELSQEWCTVKRLMFYKYVKFPIWTHIHLGYCFVCLMNSFHNCQVNLTLGTSILHACINQLRTYLIFFVPEKNSSCRNLTYANFRVWFVHM
jgi:hypothetical protein